MLSGVSLGSNCIPRTNSPVSKNLRVRMDITQPSGLDAPKQFILYRNVKQVNTLKTDYVRPLRFGQTNDGSGYNLIERSCHRSSPKVEKSAGYEPSSHIVDHRDIDESFVRIGPGFIDFSKAPITPNHPKVFSATHCRGRLSKPTVRSAFFLPCVKYINVSECKIFIFNI